MEPTGDDNNIFITQGKDYEGTKGNKFFRGLLAPRAVRYRRAMDEGNRKEKDAITREVIEGMEKNGSRLFKQNKKKGVWVEITESSEKSLDSSIKEALRSVTKKRKMADAGPDIYHQDLLSQPQTPQSYSQICPPPSTPTDCVEVNEASNMSLPDEGIDTPDLSLPQVPQVYSETCLSPSTPTDRLEVNEHINTSPAYDWYGEGEELTPLGWNSDKAIDDVKQQTSCSPDLRMPLLQAGAFEDFYANPVCDEAQIPCRSSPEVVSSRQRRNSLYLSQLEESMFNLACSKIHEKELRRNCKPVSYVGVC